MLVRIACLARECTSSLPLTLRLCRKTIAPNNIKLVNSYVLQMHTRYSLFVSHMRTGNVDAGAEQLSISSCLLLETPPLVVQIMSVYDTRYSTEAEESANADRSQIRPTVNANHPNNIPSSKTHAERLEIINSPPQRPLYREKNIYAGRARPPLGDAPASVGGGGGASNLVLSAIMRLKPIETPSMTASKMAQDIAPLRMDL